MDNLKSLVLKHLSSRHGALLDAWTKTGNHPSGTTVENHCDMVYSLALLGELPAIASAAVDRFRELILAADLPGWSTRDVAEARLSVHNCAYLLGALNLLEQRFSGVFASALGSRRFRPEQLIDMRTCVPRFPRKWAHHNWRVSHWLGGVPSIILSLEASGANGADEVEGLSARVREAVSGLMDPSTGMIRAYRSDILQRLFRIAYGFRHSPDLGDLGGVAHILWIDHASGRRYLALPEIHAEASRLFQSREPFMEAVPYCLDFDVVQALRTSAQQLGVDSLQDRERAFLMMSDIEKFFEQPTAGYTLHKIPGALATYHECGLLVGEVSLRQLELAPIDIISAAKWL